MMSSVINIRFQISDFRPVIANSDPERSEAESKDCDEAISARNDSGPLSNLKSTISNLKSLRAPIDVGTHESVPNHPSRQANLQVRLRRAPTHSTQPHGIR